MYVCMCIGFAARPSRRLIWSVLKTAAMETANRGTVTTMPPTGATPLVRPSCVLILSDRHVQTTTQWSYVTRLVFKWCLLNPKTLRLLSVSHKIAPFCQRFNKDTNGDLLKTLSIHIKPHSIFLPSRRLLKNIPSICCCCAPPSTPAPRVICLDALCIH